MKRGDSSFLIEATTPLIGRIPRQMHLTLGSILLSSKKRKSPNFSTANNLHSVRYKVYCHSREVFEALVNMEENFGIADANDIIPKID